MMFDVSNSNSGGECLCTSCRFAECKKVKSKKVELFTYCSKWCTTVGNVGVCKYYKEVKKNETDN